ncbi:hypothetical protein HK099_006266 [Clydaea vesicula]|uniref:Rotatin N-terminal domain-containing protein n=1 Tax=Clydaea vesicula TaxID=447962 RepID=A0AAD5Y334_9FUNG|nr:hypothetical protein HK099_006266 [Clydaea vesicula]
MELVKERISSHLDTVRWRAIESLKFKLKSKNITPNDLIFENNLISTLLEELVACGDEKKINTLLLIFLEISKTSPGSKLLLSLNFINILNALQEKHINLPLIKDTLSVLLGSKEFDIDTNLTLSVSRLKYGSRYKVRETPIQRVEVDRRSRSVSPSKYNNIQTRSISPFKSLEHKPTAPPYIPNRFPTFDQVFLSPIDKQIVENFANFLGKNEVEHKELELFELIIADFGPQIFLQKSSLFRLLLMGLDSDNNLRVEANIIYLNLLCCQWGTMLRKSLDNMTFYSKFTSNTYLNTLNASINIGDPPFESNNSSHGEYSISLMFASSEIFVKLLPLLRISCFVPIILKVLYGLMPYLHVHIDSILEEFSQFDGFANHYLNILFEVINHYDFKTEFYDEREKEFVSLMVKNSETIEILSLLLGHRNKWVQLNAFKELEWHFAEIMNVQNKESEICNKFFQTTLNLVITKGIPNVNPEIKTVAISIIKVVVENFKNFKKYSIDILTLLTFLQIFFQKDTSDLFYNTLRICEEENLFLTHLEKCKFYLRGLFHKNETLREYCWKILDKVIQESSHFPLDKGWNCFLFPSEFLCENLKESLSTDEIEHEIILIYERRIYELGISQLIINFFCSNDFNLEEQKETVLIMLNVFQSIAEINAHFCYQINIFHQDKIVRYSLARLLFLILFDIRYQSIVFSSKTLFGLQNERNPVVEQFILENFQTFGKTTVRDNEYFEELHDIIMDSNLVQENFSILMLMECPISIETSSILDLFNTSLKNLKIAKSHLEFSRNLKYLKEWTLCRSDKYIISELGIQEVFQKEPVSIDDLSILEEILVYLKEIINCKNVFDVFKNLILDCFPKVLFEIINPSSENTIYSLNLQAKLSDTIISLLLQVFSMLEKDEISDFVLNTNCLKILRNYTVKVFSDSEKIDNYKPKGLNFIQLLTTLNYVVSIPTLVTIVPGSVIAQTTDLFVQLITVFQRKFSGFSNGDGFRTAYKWACLNLRNISRTSVCFSDTYKPWLWGDHWLNENSLEWLIVMLNDDENKIQKIALGILGNLILIKGSYTFVLDKIPQFLDMAFSHALNFECGFAVRQESLAIINNFVITYCNDHGLKADEVNFNKSNVVDMNSNSENIKRLFLVFENSGFFDHMESLLTKDSLILSYKCILTELFLNLAIISPNTIRKKFLHGNNFKLFLNLYFNWNEIELNCNTKGEKNLEKDMKFLNIQNFFKFFDEQDLNTIFNMHIPQSLMNFKAKQNFVLDSHLNFEFKLKFLKIVWFLIKGDGLDAIEVKNFLLLETEFFNLILKICTAKIDADGPSSLRIHYDLDLIGLGFVIFGNLLNLTIENSKESYNLEKHLKKSVSFQILTNLSFLIFYRGEEMVYLNSSCQLLGKLLSYHFGEVYDLEIDKIFLEEEGIKLGRKLVVELIDILLNEDNLEDNLTMESIRISLQCFFGKCGFAKEEAIQINLPGKFISRINNKWTLHSVKLNEVIQNELFVITTLLRHLMAGSAEGKLLCKENRVHELIFDLLSNKELALPLMLETLACLNNFLANCNENKKAVLRYQRKSTNNMQCGKSEKSLDYLEVLLRCLKNNEAEGIFAGFVDVLKLLSLHGESKNKILKSNFCLEIKDIFRKVVKNKEWVKVGQILKYYSNIASLREGQLILLKMDGFLTEVIKLLDCKSTSIRVDSLRLLRLLSYLRESKSYFLSEVMILIPVLNTLLNSKSLKIYSLSTSLIWCLLYDSEKSRFLLKKYNIMEILNNFVNQLEKDFGVKLKFEGIINISNIENFQDSSSKENTNIITIPKQNETSVKAFNASDYECLCETAKNLKVIKQLLQ